MPMLIQTIDTHVMLLQMHNEETTRKNHCRYWSLPTLLPTANAISSQLSLIASGLHFKISICLEEDC